MARCSLGTSMPTVFLPGIGATMRTLGGLALAFGAFRGPTRSDNEEKAQAAAEGDAGPAQAGQRQEIDRQDGADQRARRQEQHLSERGAAVLQHQRESRTDRAAGAGE